MRSYTLNPEELDFCRDIAKKRNNANLSAGIRSAMIGNRSDLAINLQGYVAEFCFCKLYGIQPDKTTYLRGASNGTDNFDAVVNGWNIDVKSTLYVSRPLLVVALHKKFGKIPDYFALMAGMIPTFELCGFFPGMAAINEARIQDIGYGPSFVIAKELLWEDLPVKKHGASYGRGYTLNRL